MDPEQEQVEQVEQVEQKKARRAKKPARPRRLTLTAADVERILVKTDQVRGAGPEVLAVLAAGFGCAATEAAVVHAVVTAKADENLITKAAGLYDMDGFEVMATLWGNPGGLKQLWRLFHAAGALDEADCPVSPSKSTVAIARALEQRRETAGVLGVAAGIAQR